jgi:DNA/RNA endonuclease YhcR with UshA esterase domain
MNRVFTVLIWGENRSKFGTPESEYKGKRISVTGKITDYRGGVEIMANDPQQIKIE